MRRKLAHKIDSAKLYTPNSLSIPLDSNFSHQKLWVEQVEEEKHVQQQKQIDKILQGVIKHRLFGNLLAYESRISTEGFYQLDKLSKEKINPPKLPPRKKLYPLKNQCEYSFTENRRRNCTIDISENLHNRNSDNCNTPLLSLSKPTRKNTISTEPKLRRNFSSSTQLLSTSKLPNFSNYFRKLANNQTSLIFQIKLTKESILKYNRQNKILSESCLQKFLFFFNCPNSMNFKQYSNWVENTANCTQKQSCFFVFQTLDQSGNGFLTISDLFRALHDFPSTYSSSLEKEIYEVTEQIKLISAEITKNGEDFRLLTKPTVEEILIKNHALKVDELRQLLKQQSRELVAVDCVKSTTYHQSLYALEHNAAVREKNLKLEGKTKKQSEEEKGMKQDGIRFRDYVGNYIEKRSKFFIMIIEFLIGEKAVMFE